MNKQQLLIDYIETDDLSDDMRLVAEACGIETVKLLMSCVPGVSIYIPRAEQQADLLRKMLRARYNGKVIAESDIKRIAVELKRSTTFIRQLVATM